MTELQVTINNLKEACIAAELFLEKLEKAQKDLENPETPRFPSSFTVVRDKTFPTGHYVIGLETPRKWEELPEGFVGRACYNKKEIRWIITGLQTLIGEK